MATIRPAGLYIAIEPVSVARVLGTLATVRYLPYPDLRTGVEIKPTRRSSIVVMHREVAPCVVCLAGLAPAIVYLLEREGYSVHVGESTCPALPPPRLDRGKGQKRQSAPLLGFLRNHDRGMIRYDTRGIDRVALIAQIAQAYPDAAIIVLAARRATVRKCARRLRKLGLSVTAIDEAGLASPPRTQLVVTTFWHLASTDYDHADILLVLDPVAALGENPFWALSHADRPRLFGFLALNQKLAPLEDDELAAIFGFEALALRRHGYTERAVRSFRRRIVGGAPIPMQAAGLELRSIAIWRNPLRNRWIRKLAHAFDERDERRIGSLVPGAEKLLPTGRPVRTAILVENLDHLVMLARLLPAWFLLVGSDRSHIGLHAQDRSRLMSAEWTSDSLPDRAILTFAALRQTRIGRYDVLIRADGLAGIPPALDEMLITSSERPYPLLLIDVEDRYHPELRRWSHARQSGYHSRGWDGIDPRAHAQMQQFLARHSGAQL